MPGTAEIRAAGGVVWRMHGGAVQIALVHRPRYDDWTLPKGKLTNGEHPMCGAVREVREEIGARVAVSRRLGFVRYRANGARKRVDYWAMRYVSGQFRKNSEVARLRWLTPAEGRAILTYDVDRVVLDRFTALPVPDATLVLVRHAKAGKRSEWRGSDEARPLERDGIKQATAIAPFLRQFAPTDIVSAPLVRCVQTVAPLAKQTRLEIREDPAFSDEGYLADPSVSLEALLALAVPGETVVVSSQGDTIPGLISLLKIDPEPTSLVTKKGAAWVLTVAQGEIISADYYDDFA